MDLMEIGAFNFNYFKLNKKEQEIYLKNLKMMLLKYIKNTKDSYLLYVFEELYLNNQNINDLITFWDSREKIEIARNKILKLAKRMPNIQTK